MSFVPMMGRDKVLVGRASTVRRVLCAPVSAPVWRGAARAVAAPRAGVRAAHRLSVLRVSAAVAVSLAIVVTTGYAWFTMLASALYPLRPLVGLPGHSPDSWGGPTLVGAWAVHAAGAYAFLCVLTCVVAGLTRLQARVSHRPRTPRRGPGPTGIA
ncbi:hypothetical protein [Streptomyces sp. SAJ15]|uniref:hypothetical protein n=1 Tax=Streptomyces sp. SAJ15 TaxID=2011095 RepID=UPI0011855D1E|nr:hypothetical protein [Streptomyces sp. SAJ15]TVL88667.1 hypothetical protein CD790_30545 [Streptomyces sp. SAJ15]